MKFTEYGLTSNALCMGERIKAGIFRPCAKTIRYSQISGALRAKFGNNEIHAVGYLTDSPEHNLVNYFIYSPRDRALNLSKVPLQVVYLSNVLGKVFVLENDASRSFPNEPFEILMGGLVSKGFGRCLLTKVKEGDALRTQNGILNVRIPVDQMKTFDIKAIINNQPIYGYLFKPTSISRGVYVLSLFEGSHVNGPEFLLKKRGA